MYLIFQLFPVQDKYQYKCEYIYADWFIFCDIVTYSMNLNNTFSIGIYIHIHIYIYIYIYPSIQINLCFNQFTSWSIEVSVLAFHNGVYLTLFLDTNSKRWEFSITTWWQRHPLLGGGTLWFQICTKGKSMLLGKVCREIYVWVV